MNILKYMYAMLAIATVGLGACQKDFLDRAPSDFISKEEVFRNIDNTEAFLNNIYIQLPSLLTPTVNYQGYYSLDAASDLSASMWTEWPGSSIDMTIGNWSPSYSPLSYRWTDYFNAIRRINILIENEGIIPTLNPQRKNRIIGEAFALRAYFYFELFRMHGELPLIERSLDPGGEDIFFERSPVDVVVAFIKADIERAIALLPARHEPSEFGRATSLAMKALLSRLCLYHASPLFNPTGDKQRYALAATVSKEAIDFAEANGYRLSMGDIDGLKSYERIFLEENNEEVIWSSGRTGFDYDGGYWDFYTGTLGYGGWYGESPLQGLVDSYELMNGELPVLGYDENNQPIPNPASGFDPASPYENRDPRFYQTIGFHGDTYKGREVNFAPGGLDYATDRPRINYFWKKYAIADRDLINETGGYTKRYALFRLAELYLNYAEALNESEGPSDAVYSAVNEIRQRVGMIGLPPNLNQGGMRERIRNEKKVEFAFESHRFWDIRRWKIGTEVNSGIVRKVNVSATGAFTYPVWQNRVFEEKHYLLPIPQSEIDKLNGQWEQNLGW